MQRNWQSCAETVTLPDLVRQAWISAPSCTLFRQFRLETVLICASISRSAVRMWERVHMNIRYAVSLLAASSVLAGCATTPEDNVELKQLGEEEVRTRFPTLSVGCISPRIRSTDRFPEQRADLDSWAWLNDYNLIVWTHPQRRNSSWLQLDTRCNMMRNATFMSFLDSDGDNLICGTGNDYVVSTTRPLDTTESLLNRDPGIRPRENR